MIQKRWKCSSRWFKLTWNWISSFWSEIHTSTVQASYGVSWRNYIVLKRHHTVYEIMDLRIPWALLPGYMATRRIAVDVIFIDSLFDGIARSY